VSQQAADLHRGDDGRLRCWWASGPAELIRYHDEEWGRGPRDEDALFERLCLEAFQSGLSWWIVLQRRDALRASLADLSPGRLARFTDADIERALTDPGVIRHRGKIEAMVANARLLLSLHSEGTGLRRLTEEVLAAVPPQVGHGPPRRRSDVPATTPTSDALSRRLRGLGWRFIGPTTAHAYLQAVGWVDDHLIECHARGPAADLR